MPLQGHRYRCDDAVNVREHRVSVDSMFRFQFHNPSESLANPSHATTICTSFLPEIEFDYWERCTKVLEKKVVIKYLHACESLADRMYQIYA